LHGGRFDSGFLLAAKRVPAVRVVLAGRTGELLSLHRQERSEEWNRKRERRAGEVQQGGSEANEGESD